MFNTSTLKVTSPQPEVIRPRTGPGYVDNPRRLVQRVQPLRRPVTSPRSRPHRSTREADTIYTIDCAPPSGEEVVVDVPVYGGSGAPHVVASETGTIPTGDNGSSGANSGVKGASPTSLVAASLKSHSSGGSSCSRRGTKEPDPTGRPRRSGTGSSGSRSGVAHEILPTEDIDVEAGEVNRAYVGGKDDE